MDKYKPEGFQPAIFLLWSSLLSADVYLHPASNTPIWPMDESKNHSDALAACQTMAGTLAVLDSQQLVDDVWNHYR